jgi:microcystin-dependent protein
MSAPFLAEIRIFAGSFAPRNWALCNGQVLPIQQNSALFSLIGTYYGGNGTSTFALPNLQDSAPIGQGQGVGLTQRNIGEVAGESNVTLLTTQMPSHSHAPTATNQTANPDHQASPSGNSWGAGERGMHLYAPGNSTLTQMHSQLLGLAGGNSPHNNLPPYLVLTFIIAQAGIFPSRN